MTALTHTTSSISSPTVRRIGIADLRAALAAGWADFRTLRGDLLLIGLIYPVVGILASAVALNYSLLPMVFPLAAGVALLGPAVAVGFYELARRREQGEDASWRHYFDAFRGRSFPALAVITLALFALYMIWLVVAYTLYDNIAGETYSLTLGDFMRRLFTTREGWELIVFGNLAGFAFAVAAFVISVISFPLLVDRPVSPLTAVETSIRAVIRNPGPMALWGLIVAALLVLGAIPLFIGLAVTAPVLGYATWHLYTRVVEP